MSLQVGIVLLVFLYSLLTLLLLLFFFFFFFVFLGSQARGRIQAVAASLRHSQSNTRSKLHLKPTPTAHGKAECLTHWVRPGIKSPSSWMLVRFVSVESWWELPFVFVCVGVLGCTRGILRFPVQGSNWSYSCWPITQPQQCGILNPLRGGRGSNLQPHGS